MRRLKHEFDDGVMAGIEVGNPGKPYAALWLHATGFNAMTYQSMLAPLGLRTRVAALDLRGHGRTTLPAKPGSLASWTTYRNDVIAWLEKHAPAGVVLGGHSMGGCVALMVAGKRPDLVKGLVLADPVILSPAYYRWQHWVPFANHFAARAHPMAKGARKRRKHFESLEAAQQSYTGRSIFKTWREPFLADYVLDAFDRADHNAYDSDDQTWELLCAPKWEAATFAAQRNRPWSAMRRVRKKGIPAVILMGERGSVMSQKTATRLMRKNPNLVIKIKQGTTHFLPMEAPYEVRDHISSYLSRLVEGFTAVDEGHVRRTLVAGERR
ncbi:MAG: alpha/beta hydrolase [Pseudomonadota bacterium]